MKINPSTASDAQLELLKRASQPSATGAAEAGVAGAGSAGQALSNMRSAGPAASVQIDPAAQKAAKEALSSPAETTDTALLDQLRAKIEAGEFQINYDQVAESILVNAIAASQAKILNP